MSTDYSAQLAAVVAQIESKFRSERPESIHDCGECLRQFVASDLAIRGFNLELRRLLDDSNYLGDWRSDFIVFHRGTGYTLGACVAEDRRQRYIHSLPCHALHAPLGPGELICDIYGLPQQYRNELFDPCIRLEPRGSVTIRTGQVIETRSGEILDWVIRDPRLIVVLAAAPHETLQWLFSCDTLHAWRATDSDPSYTRMRVMAYVLGRMAQLSSVEALSVLTRHPSHAVRWAALQALARISRTAAISELRSALNDSHPHNRRAAESTLRRLGALG